MENNLNELRTDMTTYSKIKGKLSPDEKKDVTITGDKPTPTSSTSTSYPTSTSTYTSMATQMESTEIQPQSVINYLSKVKDMNTGEVSKPFTIADKNYQMVRGYDNNRQIVLGVMCMDELNEAGDNVIHSLDHFETNIAGPMKETMGMMGANIQPVPTEEDFNYSGEELAYNDQKEWEDYINLADVGDAKIFFVDTTTGKVVASFKNTVEMLKSGTKLEDNQRLMNRKQLMALRAGETIREAISLDEITADGTNVDKLKKDMEILVSRISKMFGNYFSKLNTDIEKGAFLQTMAKILNVPETRIASIVKTYGNVAQETPISTPASPIAESKVIKVVKVKDLNNE
jgi:hypothetical protein